MDVSSAVEVCKVVDLQLVTQTGEFFLAVSFLIMGVTTVAFVLMAFKAAHEKRKFYFIMCYVTAISTFAYYAMLSGQGWLITPNCRQLFYVRYVDWFFTTSLIFLNLGLIVGADTGLNIAIIAADMLMIFGGFMASISSGHIKWLWFSLSLLIFAPLVYTMLRGYRALVDRSNPSVVEMYSKVAWIAAITWGLYPLVFIFSEGTGDWSPNFEIMIYAVLDIMSKVVFGFVLLLSHDGLDRITNFKSFAPIREAPSYGTQMTKAPVESYI
ncbi:hypothetical protein GUITHDRAFT_85284 [Guillardia theta CCMP2712]|uniref:Uncharacterized protein n=2 Tax=Guillardia theta TaxID=55529 RepID=L1JQN0_GUITC|nr:hypothetical protein GUITHDRAFT_85284 [Guillardia theta CCMP2712]EKX50388.1 hypothetical protein GUITHDRAFT_85284 [Guillardia theta CCMP2712]|eukprot:XP_005837368.1 hypothetical protein GUITHDRAFT_85284 [Guillardia theta CCMP2712]